MNVSSSWLSLSDRLFRGVAARAVDLSSSATERTISGYAMRSSNDYPLTIRPAESPSIKP
jgi:hypothetical protein